MIVFKILGIALGVIIAFSLYPLYIYFVDWYHTVGMTLYDMPPLDQAYFSIAPFIGLVLIGYAVVKALTSKNWRL